MKILRVIQLNLKITFRISILINSFPPYKSIFLVRLIFVILQKERLPYKSDRYPKITVSDRWIKQQTVYFHQLCNRLLLSKLQ